MIASIQRTPGDSRRERVKIERQERVTEGEGRGEERESGRVGWDGMGWHGQGEKIDCKTHKQIDWAEDVLQSCVYLVHQISIIFMITCAVEVQIDYLTLGSEIK
jgi:hypothetical protein